MNKSRYVRIVKERIPRPRKGITIPASGEETGRWIRCWNCGFPINTDRGMEGSSEAEDFDYSEVNLTMRGSNPLPGNRFNRPALVEGDYNTGTVDLFGSMGTAIQLDPDGNADPFTYTPRKVVITGGCPFCGSTNI